MAVYRAVRDGVAAPDAIEWDGVTAFDPESVWGKGVAMVPAAKWAGPTSATDIAPVVTVDRDAIRAQAVDAATERLSHTTLAVSTRAAVADAIGVVADVILDAVLPTEGL